MKLFVGLGNPGSKYTRTRHNVGFMAVDAVAQAHGFSAWRKRFQGEAAEGRLGDEKVLLLKPQTFMNESGRAVGEAVRFLKIDLADVVVFYDEIDLAPGKLKVKSGGGNAGHNGLRSISAHTGNDYARVRIGVGHPGRKDLVAGYVLHDFAKADATWLEPLLDAIAQAAARLADDDHARFLTDVAQARGDADAPLAKDAGGGAKAGGRTPLPPGATGRRRDHVKAGAAAARADTSAKSRTAPSQRDLARRSQTTEADDASSPAAPAPGKPKPRRHATGERQSKRESALAENLKRWMAKRDGNH